MTDGKLASSKFTNPVGEPVDFTVALRLVLPPSGIFALPAVRLVVVATGPFGGGGGLGFETTAEPPLAPPPQPIEKLRTATAANTNPVRLRRRVSGISKKSNAAIPATAATVQQSRRAGGPMWRDRNRPIGMSAVKVVDGASVASDNVALTAF